MTTSEWLYAVFLAFFLGGATASTAAYLAANSQPGQPAQCSPREV
jgi:MFS-type transporter involved in bile tolerance (Atg22 family)